MMDKLTVAEMLELGRDPDAFGDAGIGSNQEQIFELMQMAYKLGAEAYKSHLWDELVADLEHGVKSLNVAAAEKFHKGYPYLSAALRDDIGKLLGEETICAKS